MANDKKQADTTRSWYHGYPVKAVVFPDNTQSSEGENGVEHITCSLEEEGVWFCVWMEGRIRIKYNARHLAAVIHR